MRNDLKRARGSLEHCLKRMLAPHESTVHSLQNSEVWAKAVAFWAEHVRKLEEKEKQG